MAHKTFIGGTSYDVVGGVSLVDGTKYNITKGNTLINGTGYSIKFTQDAYAMFYEDGSLDFQYGSVPIENKVLINSYTGFKDKIYFGNSSVPWRNHSIKSVNFIDEIAPISINYWFDNQKSLKTLNIDNFNFKNLTGMSSTFINCINLTGSPVCGNNVTNMAKAYYMCYNLTGSPVCGEKVINMSNTYFNCVNLTGSPVCGNNVTSMAYTYYGCRNLTGSPVCGEKVTNLYNTYSGCSNRSNRAYFYSTKVTNVRSCFGGQGSASLATPLAIYLPENSTTLNTCLYSNGSSLVGTTITWTNDMTTNGCYYNTTRKIYIYPVANVAEARLANGD